MHKKTKNRNYQNKKKNWKDIIPTEHKKPKKLLITNQLKNKISKVFQNKILLQQKKRNVSKDKEHLVILVTEKSHIQ